jgi:hypothetical protein
MASRATRKQIEREFLHETVSRIMHLASDPWPDHLWPQAAEVCNVVCKHLASKHGDNLLVTSIEHRMCEEGLLLWQAYGGTSPLHRAYQSLFDLYCEVEQENEKLRRMLGLEPDHLKREHYEV